MNHYYDVSQLWHCLGFLPADIFLDWLEQCVYIGKTKLFIFFVNFSFLKDLRDTLNYTLYTSYWGNSFTIISCSWLSLQWWWLWIVSFGSPLTSATFYNKHFFDKGRGDISFTMFYSGPECRFKHFKGHKVSNLEKGLIMILTCWYFHFIVCVSS